MIARSVERRRLLPWRLTHPSDRLQPGVTKSLAADPQLSLSRLRDAAGLITGGI